MEGPTLVQWQEPTHENGHSAQHGPTISLPKLRLPQQILSGQSHWDPLVLWPREYSILCQQWSQVVASEYIILALWVGSCEALSLQP
jgi:hypothetical protein